MMYFTYITINKLNGKVYYGVHKTERLRDGYIGCGICSMATAINLKNRGIKSHFIDAVVKYGYKNFKRKTHKFFDTREEAYKYERKVVNKNFVNNKNTYNIRIGGLGGDIPSLRKKCAYINVYTLEIKKFNSLTEGNLFFNKIVSPLYKNGIKNNYLINNEWLPYKKDKHNYLLDEVEIYCIKTGIKYKFSNYFILEKKLNVEYMRLFSGERLSSNGYTLDKFNKKMVVNQMIIKFKKSNMSIRQFCIENNLSRSTFSRYLNKENKYAN
ncbi:hypothetical protein [Lutibacter sp.]|uniref:hypothetical protein n=1 Tax=Lutibacter sp. TaxID=1925666 RepID=UPI0034A00AA4